MATYIELFGLAYDESLRKRVQVASTIAAELIRSETAPTPVAAPARDEEPSPEYVAYQAALGVWQKRRAWAAKALREPQVELERMLPAVLANNRTATVAAIIGATDATLQTAVNNAVDIFAQTE